MIERTAALRVGDPTDPETQIGPLAQPRFAEALRAQVDASLASGARQRTGGFRDGAWVDPIVLTGVEPSMRVFREETFGPVAAIARVARRGGGDRAGQRLRLRARQRRSGRPITSAAGRWPRGSTRACCS